jgi:hypothetical protein
MALTLGIHQCTQFGSDSENLLRFTECHHPIRLHPSVQLDWTGGYMV